MKYVLKIFSPTRQVYFPSSVFSLGGKFPSFLCPVCFHSLSLPLSSFSHNSVGLVVVGSHLFDWPRASIVQADLHLVIINNKKPNGNNIYDCSRPFRGEEKMAMT